MSMPAARSGSISSLPVYSGFSGRTVAPAFHAPELGNEELRAVRQQQGDAIAAANACADERRREPVAQSIQVGV